MAGVEGLDLGPDAQLGHHRAHGAQHAGRVGHHIVGLGEVHRAAVERADFGQALRDMLDALGGARHVGALGLQRQRPLGRAEHHVAAHAGGEVEHHVDLCVADALGHLAIERHVAARLAGLGIAHMAMHDRRAGPGRLDRRIRRSALGERGTCGLRSCVPPEPVTAQVMKTSRFMASGMAFLLIGWTAIFGALASRLLHNLRIAFDE